MDEQQYELFLLGFSQQLFSPSVTAPVEKGKISVNLQFITSHITMSAKGKDIFDKLIRKCLDEIWGSNISTIKCRETGLLYTFVEIAFHINEEEDFYRAVQNKSRLLIERFLGIISFCFGVKLSAWNIVLDVKDDSGKLYPQTQRKIERPPTKFRVPDELIDGKVISSEIFNALFWLRRGLAERDPIDTYNAFMVCLQILAKDWWDKKIASGCIPYEPQPRKCPHCKEKLTNRGKYPPITSLFTQYVIREFGASKGDVDEVWGLRNAIAGHGDKSNIDADVFIKITDLKFRAAEWAYQGINLALGLDLTSDDTPKPSQDFFITDALMYLD